MSAAPLYLNSEQDIPRHPGGQAGVDRLSLAGSAAILCTGGPDVIRKEAWPFDRTISGVRLWWELEEPEGLPGRTRPRRASRKNTLIRNCLSLGPHRCTVEPCLGPYDGPQV